MMSEKLTLLHPEKRLSKSPALLGLMNTASCICKQNMDGMYYFSATFRIEK